MIETKNGKIALTVEVELSLVRHLLDISGFNGKSDDEVLRYGESVLEEQIKHEWSEDEDK